MAALMYLAGGSGRKTITADTTYYVRTTGNDGNDGLTAGTPWLTLDHAIWYVNTQVDVQPPTAAAPIAITIDIGAGTFAGVNSSMDFTNSEGGSFILQGAGIGSTIITDGFNLGGISGKSSTLNIFDMTLQGTAGTSQALLRCAGCLVQRCEFALFAGKYAVLPSSNPMTLYGIEDSTVSGSGAGFINILDVVNARFQVANITYSTPTFSDAVFHIGISGYLEDLGTNAGSATGTRYICDGILRFGYGGASIQAGVGTVNGTFGATGQVQGSDLAWHGNIATPVP